MSATDARIAALETEMVHVKRELALLRDEQAIRRLHHSYGYFMDKWLFPEIVDLFAEDATLYFLNGIFKGREGARRMYGYAGEGVRGPRDGLLFQHILTQDVIDVAPDGESAKGRYHAILLVAVHDSVKADYPDWPSQFWEGGVHEIDYRKVDGVWKIQTFRYWIAYQADYATGWAGSPREPMMVAPFAATYPELPNGPDELRPMPAQWPRATFPPFHYPHPVTGRPIAPVSGVEGSAWAL
ncbi:MAG TPA: nuclear transport factor 2 family protein [Sphingomonadaceae bacterium]|jgi:hypothetical protein|nr:nuclear transport factor 2 family protein [Sphingomonadaceae bacterium]